MFHGSIVALVTPMKPDLSVDFESLNQLIEWQINEGTQGIVLLGTTGETPNSNSEDRHHIIAQAVKQVAARVPLIVGTGANNTETSIRLTIQAMELGANGVMVVTPYYNKPTQEGLFQHYQSIAQAAAIPQILYNAPGRTGVNLLPETVKRLADTPNIVAIKQASDSLQEMTDLISICGDSLDILTGDDGTASTCLLAGGRGLISVTSNVLPGKVRALCDASLSGDKELAIQLTHKLKPLNDALFCESNPIPVKWLLKEMGEIESGIRLPLTELSEKHHQKIREAFELASSES